MSFFAMGLVTGMRSAAAQDGQAFGVAPTLPVTMRHPLRKKMEASQRMAPNPITMKPIPAKKMSGILRPGFVLRHLGVTEGGLEGAHEFTEAPFCLAPVQVVLDDLRGRITQVGDEVKGLGEQRRRAVLRLGHLELDHHAARCAPGFYGVLELTEGVDTTHFGNLGADGLCSLIQPRIAAQPHGIGRAYTFQSAHQACGWGRAGTGGPPPVRGPDSAAAWDLPGGPTPDLPAAGEGLAGAPRAA
jgi:hypothetical protein